MESKDLETFGFNPWMRITNNYAHNGDLILKLPSEMGVYAIRADKLIPRIKGECDIIYIGQGNIQSRIQSLLRSYLPSNLRNYWSKHPARGGVERVLKETKLNLELCFKESKTAQEIESKLLEGYCKDHIEAPPLNNTRK